MGRDVSLGVESEMFGLLVALERDARASVRRYLEPHMEISEVVRPYDQKIRQRIEGKSDLEIDELSYLDFGDTFEIINRFGNFFPSEFNKELNSIRQSVPRLIEIRNRVMHSRPIDSLDYGTLLTILEPLSLTWWSQLNKVKEDISQGSLKVDFESEEDNYSIIHNLPLAEHSETGLVGRSTDLQKILKLLADERVSVVTIIGEGGIGKTALALQAAYRVLENSENDFDAILWVSLKQERLTVDGVQQITDAVASLQDAATLLGKSLHETFQGAIEELAEALSGLKVLICLDNLETVTGQEFTDLYDRLPQTCKFLITSRRGIGQIERRIDLVPLSENDALHFLHLLARIYNVGSLLGAEMDTKKGLLSRFKFNPLAIKWMILSLSSGSTLEEIFSRQNEFLEFCIKSVLTSVSKSANEILAILYRLMGPATIEEIVAVTMLPPDEVFDSIRELTQNGLVRSSITGAETAKSRLQLTGTVIEYLRVVAPIDEQVEKRINARLAVLKFDEQANDFEERFSPFRISLRSESDKAVAQILRDGLRYSRNDYKKGLEKIILARSLASDFSEVYRVEAWMRHFHEGSEVVMPLYETAYTLATSEEAKAIVAFFCANHLIRNGSLRDAEIWARKSHAVLCSPETYHLIGSIELYSYNFEGALPFILKSIEGTTAKTRMIHVTQLANLYRRWAERILERDRNLDLAFDKLILGYQVCIDNHKLGYTDFKLNQAHADILYLGTSIAFKAQKISSGHFDSAISKLITMMEFIELPLLDNKFGGRISSNLNILRLENTALHKKMLSLDDMKVKELLSKSDAYSNLPLYSGEVLNLHENFGFIANSKFPKNVYFSQSELVGGLFLQDLKEGDLVLFRVDEKNPISMDKSGTAISVELPK